MSKTSLGKSRPVNFWQLSSGILLVYWWRNRLTMKTILWHCVRMWRVWQILSYTKNQVFNPALVCTCTYMCMYASVCLCLHLPLYVASLMLLKIFLQDWEKRYIHVNYSKVLESDFDVDQVVISPIQQSLIIHMCTHCTHVCACTHTHTHTHTHTPQWLHTK